MESDRSVPDMHGDPVAVFPFGRRGEHGPHIRVLDPADPPQKIPDLPALDVELARVGGVLVGASPAFSEDRAARRHPSDRRLGEPNHLGFDEGFFFPDDPDQGPLARQREGHETHPPVRQAANARPAERDALDGYRNFQGLQISGGTGALNDGLQIPSTPAPGCANVAPMKSVRIVEQLAIFIANKPGTLAAVCDALAEDKINIYGLTVSDTVDHAVVRMVVSDTRRAIALLESHGTLVVENDVIMIENDNRPGGLSKIAKALSATKVNIEYAYLASMPTAKKGLLILRVSDVKKALKVLSDPSLGL